MKGHIEKRQTGKGGKVRYYVIVEGPRDPDGSRNRRSHGGYDRKRDARDALARILSRAQRGDYVEPSRRTVATFVDEWLERHCPAPHPDEDPEKFRLRPATRASYRATLERHVIPRIGGVPLQKLTDAHLYGMYRDLGENGRVHGRGGLSASSVAYVHTVLRLALEDAVEANYITKNPAKSKRAKPPTREKRKRGGELNVWTPAQQRTFIDHVADHRLGALYALELNSGMRRGELLGLRWQDVDLDGSRLRIVQTLTTRGHYSNVGLGAPKTDAGSRTFSIDPETVAWLRRHRTRQAEDRLALGTAWDNEHDLVFVAEDGTWIHPSSLSRSFKRLTKRAGLPVIRFHDLRHTYATTALAAGVPVKVVSERLGHSDISITLRTYGHVMPSMDEAAAATVASHVYGDVSTGGQ